MNTITKKITGVIALIAVLVVPLVSSAATFNGGAQDFATLRVANKTLNTPGCTTCWGLSTSASAGQVVSFAIYYHNTGVDAATNVRVRLTPQSTVVGSTQTFTATVSADNAPAVSGTATVSLTSPQSLSFTPGTASWYPNQTGASTALPFGQTGTELFNGVGLNLGTIAPGWGAQGSVTVNFLVSGTGVTGSIPTITTNTATGVASNYATINGYVNPNGTTDTTYWFEWGTTANLGNQTAHYNQGSVASNISANLTGLTQNMNYYYRVVAQNAQGIVYGSLLTFTTTNTGTTVSVPTVTTNTTTNVAPDYATINGYVNPNGTTDTTYWFEWGTTANLGNQTAHYNQGSVASNISANLTGLTQNMNYYYRVVAQNAQGIVYGNILTFVSGTSNTYVNNSRISVSTLSANPSSEFAILNGYVDPNGTTDTVRWFEWGGSQAFGTETQRIAQGVATGSYNATLTGLLPNTVYYYRAVARNSQGTVYGNAMSFTTTYVGNTNTTTTNTTTTGTAPAVTTLLATEITGGAARLNGLVFTSSNQSSNAWFEWGESTTLGNKTATVSVGSLPTIRHDAVISGLVSGHTYYYRVVAENPYGRANGSTMSFTAGTASAPIDTTVVLNTTPHTVSNVTVVGNTSATQSLMTLAIDGGAEMIANSEKRNYHVTWENTTSGTLKNIVLRVVLPATMNFESATTGVYSKVDNTVTIDIGTLAAHAMGEMFVTATADSGLQTGQLVVVTANMVYTNARNVQGDAVAYVAHKGVRMANGLAANIFGAGSFIPTTLLGWVLLIALVLLLVLLANHVYGRMSGESH